MQRAKEDGHWCWPMAQLQVSELTWALQKQQPKFVLPQHDELLLSAINIF